MLYRVMDIKITEKKNMYGEIFEIENLKDCEFYIGKLILYRSKKYWVSSIEHDCIIKRETKIFKGRKEFID